MLPFEFKRIYDILVTLFGESKQGGFSNSVTQYQFNSPWATEENGGIPDNKYNLEISFSLGKYHEWSTNYGGNISRLIKKWGNYDFVSEYYQIIKSAKESRLYDLEMFNDDGEKSAQYNNIHLPVTFTKIKLESCRNKKLVEYLNKRRITQDVIDYYNLGYTTWDEENWQDKLRLIIPSYDSFGDLNYWVGRDFVNDPNSKKTKYKNCDADKNKIIFNENKVQWANDIWLCEGIIDSLVYPNAIPLMGKFLKKDSELYKKLMEKALGNIIICLDGDTTTEETKQIYQLLNKGRLRGKIWYIDMKNDCRYKDFGEIYENEGKDGIVKIFKKRKQFSEIALSF